MLVPAQHLPISLIGSMWNLLSCWSSPGEGGVCEGGSRGVLWFHSVVRLQRGCLLLKTHTDESKDAHTKTQRRSCMIHTCTVNVTFCRHTNTLMSESLDRLPGAVMGTCTDNTEGKQSHCALYLPLWINVIVKPSGVKNIMNWPNNWQSMIYACCSV